MAILVDSLSQSVIINPMGKPSQWRKTNPEGYGKWVDRSNGSLAHRFATGKYEAKKRGLSWNLSFEFYKNLMQEGRCFYGNVLNEECFMSEKSYSLDRLDCSFGYEPTNVVPCCSKHNREKGVFSGMEMLFHLAKRMPACLK